MGSTHMMVGEYYACNGPDGVPVGERTACGLVSTTIHVPFFTSERFVRAVNLLGSLGCILC